MKHTKDEPRLMDRKTQKITKLNRIYHPKSDAGRFYIPKKGGQELLTIVEYVKNEEGNLSLNLKWPDLVGTWPISINNDDADKERKSQKLGV